MPEVSVFRLVPVPDAAPPYDCPGHNAACAPVERAVAEPVEGGAQPVLYAPAVVVPEPAAAGPRPLAVVIVEVLAGVRPDRQLVPLATDRVLARVRSLAPLLGTGRRPRIQRMVTSRPAARVVEMTVVASFGPRSRALAMRFEHAAARPAAPGWPARPARWLCTAVEAG
jgi:hypothetical protein